ncbi:MAG: metallophosphoesterase [Candidatus Heimdallarchaeota archaeon]|nr:metallophosphoesterase [Candidatus Heimdallarchaeota archaeon]
MTLCNIAQTTAQPVAQLKVQGFESYKFIAYGDTRNTPQLPVDNSGMEETAILIEDLLAEHNIEFILHDGDMVDAGGNQAEYNDLWYPTMSNILDSGVPMYVAPGNHEYESSSGSDVDLFTWRSNVQNPNNSDVDEVYYSFNSASGDTHIIVLNTEYYYEHDNDVTKQDAQMAWLEADLAASTAPRTIIMHHRPQWGANAGRLSEYPVLRAAWHDYFVNNSIDFVINGHDHHFYHTIRNDTDYMIIGAATAALTNPAPPAGLPDWQEGDVAFGDCYAVTLITVTELGFEVDVIATNGSIVYEFFVDAPVPDVYPPTLSSPTDLTFIEGTSGQTISWVVNDTYSGTYTITKDQQQDATGSWTSGQTISYDVSAFTVGTYEITLEVTDANDNTASDIVAVQVTVAPTTTPSGSAPGFELFVSLFTIFIVGIYFKRKKRS